MNSTRLPNIPILAVAALVAALGVADLFVKPERAALWLFVMALMAVICAVVRRLGDTSRERDYIVLSAVLGGLMLCVPLALPLVAAIGFDGETLKPRASGITMGLMLVLVGNATPKTLRRFDWNRRLDGRMQTLQRFAGWSFTLAGMVYVAAWVFAPIPIAEIVSTGACATAVVLVAARCLLCVLGTWSSRDTAA